MQKKKTLIIVLASVAAVVITGIVIGLLILIPFLMDSNNKNLKNEVVSTTENTSHISTTDDENLKDTEVEETDESTEALYETDEFKEPVVGSFEYSHSVSGYTMETISTQYPNNVHFYFDKNGTGIVTTKIEEGNSNNILIYNIEWELYEKLTDINTNVYAIYFEDGGVGYVFYNNDNDFCYTTNTIDNIICYYYRH